jgi:ABC-type transport system involved in multi-copper enzyme maturation permease subunit
LQLAGGAIALDVGDDLPRAVRTLQLQLAGWVADSAGLLLALVWTAGFLPAFLEAGAVSVLLVKPLPRWALLAGKFLGVLAFVAFQTTVFVAGTWLALGCRTGVWDATYFVCIPVLLLHFAVFFSFSALLAVVTRSTAGCVFGSVVFWMLCLAMNYGRHTAVLIPELQGTTPLFGHAVELGYWVLPKPLDFHIVLLDLLRADNPFARVLDTGRLVAQGAWSPVASVLASVACAAALLFVAAYEFGTAEY